jgi:hypothetical protein
LLWPKRTSGFGVTPNAPEAETERLMYSEEDLRATIPDDRLRGASVYDEELDVVTSPRMVG